MPNAFGVDDPRTSVAKSWLPSTGWKPITQMSGGEKVLLRRAKPHHMAAGLDSPASKPNIKRLPTAAIASGRKMRVAGQHSKDRFVLVDGDAKRIVHRSNLTFVKKNDEFSKIAPRMVYHGTSKKAAKKIMDSGFKEGKVPGDLGRGVYVSPRPKVGGWFSNYTHGDTRMARNQKKAFKWSKKETKSYLKRNNTTVKQVERQGGKQVRRAQEEISRGVMSRMQRPAKKRGRVVASMAVGPMKADGSWQATYKPNQLIPVGTIKGPKPKKFKYDSLNQAGLDPNPNLRQPAISKMAKPPKKQPLSLQSLHSQALGLGIQTDKRIQGSLTRKVDMDPGTKDPFNREVRRRARIKSLQQRVGLPGQGSLFDKFPPK